MASPNASDSSLPGPQRLTHRSRSEAALRKASTQQLEDGTPVHSFPTLLRSLATVCRNQVVPNGLPDAAAFELVTQPTELQARALALAGVNLASA